MIKKHLQRLRRICATLPETTERLSHGEPTFFVRKKVYAMFAGNHHNDGRVAVWLPAPFGIQEMLIASAPEKFFKPPYVGVRGWVGVELAAVNDEELAFHVREAWRQIAPPKLHEAQAASSSAPAQAGPAQSELAAMLTQMLQGLPGVHAEKSANRVSFRIGKKVFAFTQRDGVVLKLPREKINTLVKRKAAAFLIMGKREMKEWAVIKRKDPKDYKRDFKLFKEALAFAALKGGGGKV